MRIGIVGTGGVARTLAAGLAEKGHEVVLGSRDTEAALARDDVNRQTGTTHAGWAEANPGVRILPLPDAAAHGETVWNAAAGTASVDALETAGAEHLADKILVDVANPIVRSDAGITLDPIGDDSLAERIQRAFPAARVVKALNTVNAAVMTDPGAVAGGDHTLPICGDDEDAKREVAGWLRDWFGWRDVLDLGPLSAARAQEAYLLYWITLRMVTQNSQVTTKVLR